MSNDFHAQNKFPSNVCILLSEHFSHSRYLGYLSCRKGNKRLGSGFGSFFYTVLIPNFPPPISPK